MEIINAVLAAIEEKFSDLKVIRQKRSERVEAAYSEANNKMWPTVDRHGRFHAPCDGYEDVDGRGIYAKGEYLPIPESMLEEWGAQLTGKEFGKKARILVESSFSDELSAILSQQYGLRPSAGKKFERGGTEMNYIYVSGNEALATVIEETVKAAKEAEKAAKEAERAARKALKGKAPNGKQALSCKLIFVRPYVPMDSWDRGSDKMMVEFENKSTAWGTLPKALRGAEIGTEFVLSATFSVANDDETHAFFSRPCVK